VNEFDYQRETLELLIEIDEQGEGLTSGEIDFVARLIDSNADQFNIGQARKIRSLHRRSVEEYKESDDEEMGQ
jgi:hypothetical protein